MPIVVEISPPPPVVGSSRLCQRGVSERVFAKSHADLPFVKPACQQAGEERRDLVLDVRTIMD